MAWLGRLFWLALALVIFFFAALAVNQDAVALEFLAWTSPSVSVFWWLVAAFGLGLLLGLIGLMISSARLGLRNRRLARQLDEKEQELRRVRNMPLQE